MNFRRAIGRWIGGGSAKLQERGWESALDFSRLDPGWFQKAADLATSVDITSNTAAYACANIISQEVASLKLQHWRSDVKTGERELVLDSAAARVVRKPNTYQTSSDFWLYGLRSLLFSGAMFAYAERNNRNEISALHPLPPRSCHPLVGSDGSVFFSTGNYGQAVFSVASTVPARSMLNPRINCNRHPLIGETPIAAFVLAGATGNAVQGFASRFFRNMGRPSGVLMTPKPLTAKQLEELRKHWNDVTQGDAVGGTPVLHSDLKWQQVTMSAVDAETIDTYKMSVSDVAMAFRVPLFMLGDLSKATFRNVETLMRLFYTSSLRFYLEHLEDNLNALFGFDGTREYLEFDIESGLLRGDLEQRISAWTSAVQGGIMTPNEGRAKENLPPKPGGDSLFLQRQMVPVDRIKQLLDNEDRRQQAQDSSEQTPAAQDQEEDEAEGTNEVEQALTALFEKDVDGGVARATSLLIGEIYSARR